MLKLRRSADRGYADHGWLQTRHTFSFSDYFDPNFMGFGALRVINEDRVQGGAGFPKHGHRDMEILSYVVSGGLEHKDSMGNGSVLGAGHVQVMSAGRGVLHSEYNADPVEPVHFLQIWIMPETTGLRPSYEERVFHESDKKNQLRLIASGDAREGSLKIHQQADCYAAVLDVKEGLEHTLQPGHRAWIQLIQGGLLLQGQRLEAGDGVSIEGESRLEMVADLPKTEFILFDLAS